MGLGWDKQRVQRSEHRFLEIASANHRIGRDNFEKGDFAELAPVLFLRVLAASESAYARLWLLAPGVALLAPDVVVLAPDVAG